MENQYETPVYLMLFLHITLYAVHIANINWEIVWSWLDMKFLSDRCIAVYFRMNVMRYANNEII